MNSLLWTAATAVSCLAAIIYAESKPIHLILLCEGLLQAKGWIAGDCDKLVVSTNALTR